MWHDVYKFRHSVGLAVIALSSSSGDSWCDAIFVNTQIPLVPHVLQGDAETALERLSDVLEKDLPNFYTREDFWREKGTARDEVCHPGAAFGTWTEARLLPASAFHTSLFTSWSCHIIAVTLWVRGLNRAFVPAVPGGGIDQQRIQGEGA